MAKTGKWEPEICNIDTLKQALTIKHTQTLSFRDGLSPKDKKLIFLSRPADTPEIGDI